MKAAVAGAALLLAALLAGGATSVRAEENNHLLRFYYGLGTVGTIQQSPQDPTGAYTDQKTNQDDYAQLELILWRRVGISGTQHTVRRTFGDAAGNRLHEDWTQTFLNLTLYLRESAHSKFNLFLGGGTGSINKYSSSINGTLQTTTDLEKDIPADRAFAGFEYTFERVGFRAEYVQVNAHQSLNGQTITVNQAFETLSFYIPFN